MIKVNNRNIRTRFEICSNLTIKTPEQKEIINIIMMLFNNDVNKNMTINIFGFKSILITCKYEIIFQISIYY